MHPVLFHIGNIPVGAFNFSSFITFIIAAVTFEYLGRNENVSPDVLIKSLLIIVFAGLAGARFVFVLTELDYFLENPLQIFSVTSGGIVLYGWIAGGCLGVYLYTYLIDVNMWHVSDICYTVAAVTASFNRAFGCVLNGCCYGKPCDLPWGIRFPQGSPPYEAHGAVPLHPTQIYSSLVLLILFIFLMWFRKKKSFHGQLTCLFFLFYAPARFVMEYFRGDKYRGFLGPLSTSQMISILTVILASLLYWYLSGRQRIEKPA